MRRAPRLVATDLDGTLLRSDGTVSARTAAVLAELDARGVPVVFVTARPIRWIAELADAVGGHGLVVCSNGAVLLHLHREEVELARTMPAPVALAAVAAIRAAAPGAVFALEGLSGFAKESAFVERTPAPPGSPVGPVEDLVREDDVLKLMARSSLPPDAFRAVVTAAVRDAEVTASDRSGLVELSADGVTKASTLALLAARLDVDPVDVVAFGDMPNDAPMLAWAGRSYAVADAHPAAIAAAAGRAPGNDDDGVARVLADLFDLG
ncbi:HAD family hydrolase [Amnibacterium kyonggiense]|uniref:Uncharacterized protein n=1 Tax=Amnibacterium kyonggiense TaxID=595671 RepID=A0A4R7FFT9_9MICO|nr:HAD family hydrolase [Amnibacterium kyonggiense]TDS75740.1 hypothetical protein CLV52_2847 [Amnibacterium kyonggiense]